jgi:hypothetical protein
VGRLSGMRPWRRAGQRRLSAEQGSRPISAPTSPPGERASSAAGADRVGARPHLGARTGRVRRQDAGWVIPGAEGQQLPKLANHLEVSWSALLFATIDAVLPDPVAKGRVIEAQLPGDLGDRLAGGAHQLASSRLNLGVNFPVVLGCWSGIWTATSDRRCPATRRKSTSHAQDLGHGSPAGRYGRRQPHRAAGRPRAGIV